MIKRIIYTLLTIFCIANTSFANDLTYTYKAYDYNDSKIIVLSLSLPENYYTYASTKSNELNDFKTIDFTTDLTDYIVIPPKSIPKQDYYDPNISIDAYTGTFNFYILFDKAKNFTGNVNLLLCSKENCVPVKMNINFVVADNLTNFAQSPDYADFITLSQKQNTFTSVYFNENFQVSNILMAILFGFLAGLILNIMPCVLPVISLKITALLSTSQDDFKSHNLFYSFGVIVWFVALAFLFSFLGLNWGAIFQSQIVVLLLLVLVFLLALSLLGVFNLPIIDLKNTQSKNPKTQAFFTGLLATLLATPCSGPLLGAVLAFSFFQSYYIIFLVFIATGLGMASPFILLAFKPSLARYLPKPGNWLGVLEKILAFTLFGTAIYLLSILPSSKYINYLILLLVLSLLVYIYKEISNKTSNKFVKILLLCLALGSIYLANKDYKVEHNYWQSFSQTQFDELLGKENILVEFTADWCPTCKFLEKTVLTPSTLDEAQKDYNLRLYKADITTTNPQAEELLLKLGSVSIPVTAIFPKGDKSSSPIVLRDIYTKKDLTEALKLLNN